MNMQKTIENVHIRLESMQLTRKHFWPLLGMLLIVTVLLTLVDQPISDAADRLLEEELLAIAPAFSIMSEENQISALIELFLSPTYWGVMLGVWLLNLPVGATLNLGHRTQLIRTARGEKPQVLGVFGGVRHFLKAIGLELWIALKTFLWAFPGFLVFDTALVFAAYELEAFAIALTLISFGVTAWLVAAAALRYDMARYLLSEEPDRGVRACVTLSKGLMKGRKWQYFKLCVPHVLNMVWLMLGTLVALSVVAVLIGLPQTEANAEILGNLALIPTVYFLLQMGMSCAAFYVQLYQPKPRAEQVSYWLRSGTPDQSPAPEVSESTDAPTAPSEIPPETNEVGKTDPDTKEANV